jgi:hypothetical protein
MQESNNFIAPSFVAFSDAVNGAQEDLFSRPNLQQQFVTGLYPSVDFFANMPPTIPSSDKIPLEAPSLDNAGWATFDTPPKDKQPGVTGPSLVVSIDKQILGHDLFLFEPSDRPASFLTSKDKVSVSNQSGATSHDTSCSQVRNICIALGISHVYEVINFENGIKLCNCEICGGKKVDCIMRFQCSTMELALTCFTTHKS